jgi:arsenate reductase
MKIYHNPRCRKSRETLQILLDNNIEVDIVEYLKHPLTKKEIKNILKLLGISAKELVRKGEKLFKNLYKGQDFSEEEYVNILSLHPILIERPIVVKYNRAVLGRPPINVLALLDKK